ncbi:hypothetical protein COO60DRAFT_1269129 [Scenedesmus sp. NREL 46B-D3]|nr:hypothetical protein COO60DRAFT_1269129 [Scenedesmus sp. NREL 46B-D3]
MENWQRLRCSSSNCGSSASVPAVPLSCKEQQQECRCAVVIVDHGSRRKASNDMLLEFCQLYQQLTQHSIVEPAHMEIAEPTIAQAVGRCVEAGASRVVIAPYFLSRGRHIQEDIPALVAAAQEQFAGVSCSIADPIGIDPLMVQLIQSRVSAALLKDCGAAADPSGASEAAVPSAAAATTGQR